MVVLSDAALRRAGEAAFPAFRLELLARTRSTQDVVRRAARAGEPAGLCCVAAEQTAGRGRQGRSWTAPPGTALLMSLLLREPAATLPGIPLAAGLAVADAVRTVASVECRLKWPNDVLAGSGKLAGILAEAEPRSGAVVLGVGVNLTVPEFPDGVPGVSLHELAPGPVERSALLAALLTSLRGRLDALANGGIPALLPDWRAIAAGLGGPVRTVSAGREIRGTAVDIDTDGALIVETADGTVRLLAGDVHLGT